MSAKRASQRAKVDFDAMSDEEFARFWEEHSVTEFWEAFERVKEPVFERRPKRVLSLRIAGEALELLKVLAREKGLTPTALARMWVLERLRHELAERQKQKTNEP